MYKIIVLVVLNVFFKTVAYGQTESDTTLLFKNIFDMLEESKRNMEYKTGDFDGPETIGLLKTFISNNQTKFQFGKVNPRIDSLLVEDKNGNNIQPFSEWIKEDFTKYNSSQYTIEYLGFTYPSDNSESLYIRNQSSREMLRIITIVYSDFNESTKTFNNLRMVSDNIVE
jgi:hypothetical protein